MLTMKGKEKLLIIGSGPIMIGQAAEFDYAGTQACIALKEEGYRIVLVNNNPATIMTDTAFADQIYFEPLTVDSLEKIIAKERPDGLIVTFGGQTGLNLALELDEKGILEKYKVKLLGSSIHTIKKGENRKAFRQLMDEILEPVPESETVHSVEEALCFAHKIGYPLIVRPAFTLGGTGSGIAHSEEELKAIVLRGLGESPIHQCLVERCIKGYREIEFEVIRDKNNRVKIICDLENIDPVGIHTGDSLVVAPSQTLTKEEYETLYNACKKIVCALDIVGACNIQFALHPENKNYYVIEVNPRVSRSSALASKATGFPIARIAAKLAIGKTLLQLEGKEYKEGINPLDHCVVKIPKWPFDKFPMIDRSLGTMMKATGEVMGLDKNIEGALMKAIDSLELKNMGLILPHLQQLTTDTLFDELRKETDERLFIIFELMRRGMGMDVLKEETNIHPYFLKVFENLIKVEKEIGKTSFEKVNKEKLSLFKEKGFSDKYLANVWETTEKKVREKRYELGIQPKFQTVKINGQSISNYYYSTYIGKDELVVSPRKKVVIIGSGPIRIGQGIEFDYCTVHGVFAARDEGYETIMINNNPETVSTDFSVADKLYFEPLTTESILQIMEFEQTKDCIVQFGGQTGINLAKELEENGMNILGTAVDVLHVLEERDLFYKLLDRLNIPHLQGATVENKDEFIQMVDKIGYPVLLRPSYVIGGFQMETIYDEEELIKYLQKDHIPFPLLVDKFLHGKEGEMDLVTDGQYMIAPTVIEHIEKTGVHSGDSMAILPSQTFTNVVKEKMLDYGKRICQFLQYKGLMNIQYIIDGNEVYVLEVNPRASRTVPIVSKVTDVPLLQIATKILLGKYSLSEIDEEKNVLPIPYVAVKFPVFSHFALKGLDTLVSPEMRSTGEGISIGATVEEALRKAFHQYVKWQGKIIVTEPVPEIIPFLPKGITLEMEDREKPLSDDIVVYYNPGKEEWDKKRREEATKKRILTVTQLETLKAFIKAYEVKDFSVKALTDWLIWMRGDVSVK